MNVYQKLQQARTMLQSMSLKKSGHNKFAGYQYFELGDFLPVVQDIFGKLGLCGIVSFNKEIADLRIVNTENPEDFIIIESPMSEANLKGCHPIQNLGAVETYTRRYLWVTAMEIVEHDALDSSQPVNELDKASDSYKKAKVTPTAGAFEKMEPDEVAFLNGFALEIQGMFNYGESIDSILDKLDNQHLETEEKVAVWSLLDSKCRSAITKRRKELKESNGESK